MADSDGKPGFQDIQEYSFHSFDQLEADIQGRRDVQGFEFKSFEDQRPEKKPSFQTKIRKERTAAKDKCFEIAPVVRHHRGIVEQEETERERRIHEEVERRVAEVYSKALEDGRTEGIEIGRQEVFEQTRSQAEEKLEVLTHMINNVLAAQEEILKDQKTEIYSMIRNLTKWVILRELNEDGAYLERLLEKLIIELQSRNNLLIQVNKNDFEKMPEILEVVSTKLGGLENIRLEIDFDISEQGIVVESENGIIAGTLETQFQSLDKLFESVGLHESEQN
ncbi:MAG: hypothetical protein KAG61_03820 [Bacteriovoracaceae bacterium]|nr:hypothetical protein [Bacteriovoracaceae bacterium]